MKRDDGRWMMDDGKKSVGKSRGRGVEKVAAPSTGHRPRTTGPRNPQGTGHAPSTLRLFYALRVPTEVSSELAQVQTRLKGNWRAVNPGQMHVTLAYLPAVPPARLDDLKRLGTRLMGDLPPLNVNLRGTGYFPNEGSPRVWFVKVEADGLAELAQSLRAGVQELGIQTDDLPFKAHITLARKKGPAPRVPPLTFEHLHWTATGGSLYRSILRKTGPIYEVESTFRFRGGAPPSPPLSFPIKGERNNEETQPGTQET